MPSRRQNRLAVVALVAWAGACASSPPVEETPLPAPDGRPAEVESPATPRATADAAVTTAGRVRVGAVSLDPAVDAAALRAALSPGDAAERSTITVDVPHGAPAAAVVHVVLALHAPEAPPCVVRLRWDDVTHDVARPRPPSPGRDADLPVIVRWDTTSTRITPPTDGGTRWFRVASDPPSLVPALRAESQRSSTTRAIISFPNDSAAAAVATLLTVLTDAGYDDVTFTGTF